MRSAAALLALMALGPASDAAAEKIAYVDLQRALQETKDGKAAKDRLKKMFEEKQKQLDREQETFKKAKEEFDQQKAVLRPEVVTSKERELEAKFVELQALYVKLQKELSAKEAELTQDIVRRMQQIIHSIAEREGFSMVFEKSESNILWAQPALDLTNEVIRLYDTGGPDKAKGKK